MTLLSAALGGGSGLTGASLSAVFPRLPSGAMIVLAAGAMFFGSMLAGSSRGVAVRFLRRQFLNRSIDRQHLLRGLYEQLESRGLTGTPDRISACSVPFDDILAMRSWSATRLRRQVRRSERQGLVSRRPDGSLSLTVSGAAEAARLVHEHRLWELYLITHAEIAPSSVDRNADAIEHVLEPEMIDRLEALLEQRQAIQGVARSPHPMSESRLDPESRPETEKTAEAVDFGSGRPASSSDGSGSPASQGAGL